MNHRLRSGASTAVLFTAAFLVSGWCSGATDDPFMAENHDAMDKMMSAMMVAPSGDVDADFVNMMEPHHQGAIDMAVLELKYGRNEKLRRIAQEIVVDQQQEIVAMRLALHRPLPALAAAPTGHGRTQ